MAAPGKSPLGRAHLGAPTNLVERRMTRFMHSPPSVRLAASVIVTATSLIVVVGGILMRVVDHSDYSSIWLGMWWVLQTVTTVGYGDVVPTNTVGKLITAFVMLEGIAFLSIITAGITSVFVARAEQERRIGADAVAGEAAASAGQRFDRIDAQLAELVDSVARLDEALRSNPPR
ncbi:MAG: potassium channel family protein [Gaiellaceae bacterium]